MLGLKLIHGGKKGPPCIVFDYSFRIKVEILIIQVKSQPKMYSSLSLTRLWDFWQIICNTLANLVLGVNQPVKTSKTCVATAAFSVNCIHMVTVFSTNCHHRLAHVYWVKSIFKSGMKMQLEQRRQAMLQLHLSDQQFNWLLRCGLYYRFGGSGNLEIRD